MKILITNDDSINSEGIRLLEDWAAGLGEVWVVAPKFEQSGKSHSIEIHKAFQVKETGPRRFSVDSSPADCIRFAITGLDQSYDLVLSGINKGFNIGADIAYSGTAGAIFEAAYFGCRALAVSTDPESFDTARKRLDEVYAFVMDHRLFEYNGIYNINIPDQARTIRMTRQQDEPYYMDRFIPEGEGMFIAQGYSAYRGTCNIENDIDAVMNGYISITPLQNARTNCQAFEALRGLSEAE